MVYRLSIRLIVVNWPSFSPMAIELFMKVFVLATIAAVNASRELRGHSASVLLQDPDWGCPLDTMPEHADFWDGSDAADNSTVDEEHSPHIEDKDSNYTNFLQNSRSTRYATDALLFGMFDSGTNLLEKFTKKNIPGFRISNVRFGNIWKHLYPAQILRRVPKVKRPRTLVMAVVRNPVSQISGWKKAPYDLGRCLKSGQWLGQSCMCGSGHGSMYDCSKDGLAYRGFPDVWNSYVRGYKQLERAGFMKVVTVRYEDLVMSPENVLKTIAMNYGVPLTGNIKTIDRPAKKHGSCIGREKAIHKLTQRTYRNTFDHSQLALICSRLDASLLRSLNYQDECPGSHVPQPFQTASAWKPPTSKTTTTTSTRVQVAIKIRGVKPDSQATGVSSDGGTKTSSRTVRLGAQSNLCLNVFLRGDKIKDGDVLGFWDCSGGFNEQLVVRADHTIRVEAQPEYCLSIFLHGTSILDGDGLGMFPCNGSWNQRFLTFPDGTLRPMGHTSFCFSVVLAGSEAKKGDHAGLYNCVGSSGAWNQRFFVK